MKKLLLVVNPYSGQKKAQRYLSDIIALFNRLGFDVLSYMTACAGDGETAVVRLAGEVDRVICCGGDGTFSEVVSGILKSGTDVPIGYIPTGSTNDYAASLQLNPDLMQAARDAVESAPRRLDVGRFGERHFAYIASFGAFTRTSYATPQSLKNLLGHMAYVLNGIQELSQLKTYPLRFETAEGAVIEGEFIFGSISNTYSMGHMLTLSPEHVDMGDGVMELLLIRAPKDLFELSDCVRALWQKTYNCSMISFINTASVSIDAPADMAWTLDGEYEPGHTHIDVHCLHQAIQVAQSMPVMSKNE